MSIDRIIIEGIKNKISKIRENRMRKRWLKKSDKFFQVVAARDENIPLDIDGYTKRWSPISKHVDPTCFKTYSYVLGEQHLDFVSEDLYYMVIEPILNRSDFYWVYRDKNIYDKYNAIHPGIFPDVLLRNLMGVYYDVDYKNVANVDAAIASWDAQDLVVKPSIDTGSGRNVQIFHKKPEGYVNNKEEVLSLEYLNKRYGMDFLVQDRIRQHEYFNKFNRTSVNSIRMTTYRSVKTEEVTVLHSNMRMGAKGALVDNCNIGGVAIHIDDNGKLNDFATDTSGNKHYAPPSNPGLTFSKVPTVPHFEEMKEMARKIAGDYFYFRMLGFDFCLQDDGKPRLLEINFGGLGICFQMDSGPLFGKHTDEIIDYVVAEQKKKKA
ncbi:MAG: hypothetical protein GY765_43540 [bacterium]|nr:hypothetical protein [bacterium]